MRNKKPSFLLRFFGYCELEIPISTKEKFLNLCMRYGFDYYNLQIDEENKRMLVRIALASHKRILTACRVWEIRAKIIAKRGLIPKAVQYRGRWGLLAGAILSIVLFCLSQSVLWRIDIVGNKRLSEEQIIKTLSQNGLCVGERISNLNLKSIEQRVMINDDEVAWISINLIGVVARVEVKEVIDTEIIEQENKPANIVSSFDAQIVALEVLQGFPVLKEGDFVRAGDLIVSGIYKSEKAPLRYTRASGKIFGRVTKQFEVEIPLVQMKKVPTGEKITKKTLNFFGKSINFFINYRNLPISYDIINYVYTFNPFSLGKLPISLSVDEYYAYENVEIEITDDEAMEQAYESLRLMIDDTLPDAQILRKTIQGEFVDGKYVLKCTITAICDIAKQVEFEVLN